MSEQNPPLALQNGSHSAAELRQMMTALFGDTQPGTLTYAAGGVVGASDLQVTQNGTPNMSINVAGGALFIAQTRAANQGVAFCLNDGTVNKAIATADPTNPRVDLVCAVMNDSAFTGSLNTWAITVVSGTPTSGANLSNLNGAGALPAAALPLAYVLVPAASSSVVTGNISDVRIFQTIGGQRLYNNGDSGWITISSFSNSWGAGSIAPAYRKVGNLVTLRGRITGGTASATAFTLPSGYRPQTTQVQATSTASTANGVTIDSSGNVTPNASVNTSLDSVSFYID